MTEDDGTSVGADTAGRPAAQPLPSDPAAIEQLIARRRASLASTIDELTVRAHPKEIARRSALDAQARARAFAFTDAGQLRVERVAAVAGAVMAAMSFVVLLRRRRRRSR